MNSLGFVYIPMASGSEIEPNAPGIAYDSGHPLLEYMRRLRPDDLAITPQRARQTLAAVRESMIAMGYQGADKATVDKLVRDVSAHLAYALVPPAVPINHRNSVARKVWPTLATEVAKVAAEVASMPPVRPRIRIPGLRLATQPAPAQAPASTQVTPANYPARPTSARPTRMSARPTSSSLVWIAVVGAAAAVGLYFVTRRG